jgi:choline dehydrogenase-like flavoprotein
MATSHELRYDAIVVGSGATGAAMAAYLAEGGKRVLILEAGPKRTPADLVSSTLHARRLKWSGAPVIEEGREKVGHVFNAGYGLGGSALHHYAVWPRMHVEDFEMRTRYGRGHDWPFAYAELAPYYDDVQIECGVSGDAAQEVWRPPGAPYPMPPVPQLAQATIVARGFTKLGKRVAPLPLAVTTTTYRGRPPCIWDGWCDSGCPIGALANPLTVHLPRAQAAGATILTGTTVTRVRTAADGTRATGVDVVRDDGSRASIDADLVVLAAFAVENPRLLLASASERHPGGLGNAHDQLGRYVTSHTAGLIYGLFDEPTSHFMGAFGGQLVNQDSYPKTTHAAVGAFGSYQWMIAQALKPNDLLGVATTRADLIGDDVHAFMKRAAHGFASMTAVVEDLPVADNRVTLAERTDAHGVPLARVVHNCDDATLALWKASLEEGRQIFNAAGAREVWIGPPGRMHIMGGTIMGRDPRTSVTNQYGQVHGLANLVVTGPGLFPTSAGVNPTFTAHAVTMRSARHLLGQWRGVTA